MRTNRILIYAILVLGTLLAGQSRGEDGRIAAVEALLLARWDGTPENMVVEIVLDPVIGQTPRYRVLRCFLDKQKTVARHREYVQQNYLPRLEKMYREMPAEDVRAFQLILKGMADLQQERDQSDSQIREFLYQQLAEPALSPARRIACQGLLSEIQGQAPSSASETWRAEERQITDLLAKGSAADAYRLALSVLSDGRRSVDDRAGALKRLDQMLAYPTGTTFEQVRQDLAGICAGVQEQALAKSLVGSIMRVAFLERMDPEHVLAVARALEQNSSPAVRAAAATAIAEAQVSRQQWSFDPKAHRDQAELLVRQANLDSEAQQEYRQLLSNPDYYARSVGQAQRWWFLGKFLWRHRATNAAVEAFRQYLQTREPSSRVDDYLREAVKVLAEARPATEQEPYLYWANLARLPKSQAAQAFVRALAEELSSPEGRRVLAQFAVCVLQQGAEPSLAQAVLENILLSPGQVAPLESAGFSGEAGRYCRTAIAAALAREGKSAEAVRYLDLGLTDPLPGVPLFRATGVADVLFASGQADAAETVVRSLLRRPGAAAQRTNLLVYLLNQQLQAGHTNAVVRIQEELTERYGVDSPAAVVAAFARCIGLVRDKSPEAATALMRASCEILNGETYPGAADNSLPAKQAAGFWSSVLAWSQDNTRTKDLEEFVQRQPGCWEADLARVLLARYALDLSQADRAADLLRSVEDLSSMAALAGEQRRRLQALRNRDAVMVSTIRQQAGALAEAAEQKGMALPAVEAFLLLAEFEPSISVRMQALSRAAELCGQHDLRQVYGQALRALLDAVRSQCEDAQVLAECTRLGQQIGESLTPASLPAEPAPSERLEAPFDAVYAEAMEGIGMAFRTAGQYRRAVEIFHRGWRTAPLAERAADCLKEEVWTLRYYMAAMEESQVRLRQLVAIYPYGSAGRWARVHIGILANPEHPE